MFLAGLQSAAAIQIKHPAGGRIQAPYTVNSIHIHWHTCPGNGSVISNHIHHAQSYPNISPADADTCLTAGVHLGSRLRMAGPLCGGQGGKHSSGYVEIKLADCEMKQIKDCSSILWSAPTPALLIGTFLTPRWVRLHNTHGAADLPMLMCCW